MSPPAVPPRLELKGVHKAFGGNVVLDGVNLAVAPGRSLVIIGGSGEGKSVTIKIAAGLMRPDAGKVFIDGRDVTRLRGAAQRRRAAQFGFLFQGAALFDSLSVWQNVAFRLMNADGVDRHKARQEAIDALSRVGLGKAVADLYPGELSGGMQKRVGLARAVVAHPEIIFFDEPTTGLDPINANVINNLIVEEVKRLGCTAVSITHDLASARKIGDEIAMLHDGKIIWRGPAADIDRSGHPYVEQFVQGRAGGPIPVGGGGG
jgi:phospholipid/cholesterol/gamma-HCH transport system ATP-binding protein